MAGTDSVDGGQSQDDGDPVQTARKGLLESGLLQYFHYENAENFCVAISPFGRLLRHSVPPAQYLFRGVDGAKHGLLPSALRAECQWHQLCPRIHLSDTVQITDKQQIELELNVLGRFFRHADSQGVPLPEDSQEVRRILNGEMSQATYLEEVLAGRKPWPAPSLLSIMGLAQHYGLPTRLLDWSKNPFKAAYFGARRAAQRLAAGKVGVDDRIAVWTMSRSMIDITSCLTNNHVDGAGAFPVSVITSPAAWNPNLRAQEAVFSLSEARGSGGQRLVDRRPLEVQVCDSMPPGPQPIVFFTRFTLPDAESDKLLWILASVGVSAASVFSDPQGAAMAVREENLWKRPTWDAH